MAQKPALVLQAVALLVTSQIWQSVPLFLVPLTTHKPSTKHLPATVLQPSEFLAGSQIWHPPLPSLISPLLWHAPSAKQLPLLALCPQFPLALSQKSTVQSRPSSQVFGMTEHAPSTHLNGLHALPPLQSPSVTQQVAPLGMFLHQVPLPDLTQLSSVQPLLSSQSLTVLHAQMASKSAQQLPFSMQTGLHEHALPLSVRSRKQRPWHEVMPPVVVVISPSNSAPSAASFASSPSTPSLESAAASVSTGEISPTASATASDSAESAAESAAVAGAFAGAFPHPHASSSASASLPGTGTGLFIVPVIAQIARSRGFFLGCRRCRCRFFVGFWLGFVRLRRRRWRT